jgi:hypothetical protein
MFAPALVEYQAYHRGENGSRLFLMRHGRNKAPEEVMRGWERAIDKAFDLKTGDNSWTRSRRRRSGRARRTRPAEEEEEAHEQAAENPHLQEILRGVAHRPDGNMSMRP